MRPTVCTLHDVADTLADAAMRVRHNDSFEGSITWEALPKEGPANWAMRALYRIGNSEGQGGMRMFGDTDGAKPHPAEPWGALRQAHKALQQHLQCLDCKGTGVLERPLQPYSPNSATYTEECFCVQPVKDAYAALHKVLATQDAYLIDMRAMGVDTAA